MGKFCSIYIFESREDRRNIGMYQKLAEMIYRINGFIRPQNIAEARKSDRFYCSEEEAKEINKTTLPLFETRRGDLFLWVEGQKSFNDISYLREVAQTEDEKELVMKVQIGYTCHHEEGYWFRERDEDVQTRDFGKATELMRRPGNKNNPIKTGEELYFYIQGEDGTGFTLLPTEIEQFMEIDNFVNRHYVVLEFTARSAEEADNYVKNKIQRPYVKLPDCDESIDMANYYDLLFLYFRRLQMSKKDLPANFWDWLEPEKEELYFKNALLYHRTRIVYSTRDNNDVA